jgi:hypothetical protein
VYIQLVTRRRYSKRKLSAPQITGQCNPVFTGFAPRRQCRRITALGQFLAIFIDQQFVVPIHRLQQAQHFLQQYMDCSICKKVFAADDMADMIGGIVASCGQMIAGGRILSPQYYIAKLLRVGSLICGL